MTFLLMAIAGGLGAAARFVVDGAVTHRSRFRFPLGTAIINITGSLLLGFLTGWGIAHSPPGYLATILGTGFLGGYTTFSTASVEPVRMAASSREVALAVAYVIGMLIVSLGAAAGGLWLATR